MTKLLHFLTKESSTKLKKKKERQARKKSLKERKLNKNGIEVKITLNKTNKKRTKKTQRNLNFNYEEMKVLRN